MNLLIKKTGSKENYYKIGKLNRWNGRLRITDIRGQCIEYDDVNKKFAFWNESIDYIMDKCTDQNKDQYYYGGHIWLKYSDSINLFYNLLRSYEIYMDYFVVKEVDQLKLNPEFKQFKELLLGLKKEYYKLLDSDELIELEQPDFTKYDIHNKN